MLMIFAVAFVIEVVALAQAPASSGSIPVSADSYRAQVDALLKIGHR